MIERTIIRPTGEPLVSHLDPREMWRTLRRDRHVIRQLGRRQVQARHRGSFLGMLWIVLNPLLLLGVYTLVFTEFLPFGADEASRMDFVLQVFCGLVVFNVFSETVQRAPTAVVANANYVKKCVFPLEALPVADLWASAVFGALNLAVLTAVTLLARGSLPWTAVLFPLVVPPLLLFTLGLSWLVAALGVFVRDIAVAIGVMVTALFFLTPIVYRLEDVGDWRWLMQLNPLAVLVDATRTTLLAGEPPNWITLAAAYVLALVVAQLGFAWFRATKRGFADVV